MLPAVPLIKTTARLYVTSVRQTPVVTMASARALGKLPMPATNFARIQSQAIPRLLHQTSRRAISSRPILSSRQAPIARQFRRGYAEEAAPAPVPKKRRFRVWRWTWRLLNLSLLGGVAYIGYGIYQDRHPEPQAEPDPSKKTLVILGIVRRPISPSPAPTNLA